MGNRPKLPHSCNELFRREIEYDIPMVIKLKYFTFEIVSKSYTLNISTFRFPLG